MKLLFEFHNLAMELVGQIFRVFAIESGPFRFAPEKLPQNDTLWAGCIAAVLSHFSDSVNVEIRTLNRTSG